MQFHFEVLKKLHSMKSSKSLVECHDTETLTYERREDSDLESVQPNFMDNESECRDIEIESTVDFDFEDIPPEILKTKLSKILMKNQELQDALEVKDRALRKLLARNAELENVLKRKEAMRLSQLELLALRNVELERELHESRKHHVSRLDDVA